jgi:predicted AAA+ superfamily ATPase
MSAKEPKWIETPGFKYIIKEMVPEAAQALRSDEDYVPVLIVGPTGVGKSYVLLLLRP